jgi:SAM-dependent methyltransferase
MEHEPKTDFFSYQTAAKRYVRSRPWFHPIAVERIRAFLKLEAPVTCALDVACGTGLSTLALKEIATEIVGTDTSKGMLDEAPHDPQIRYVEAPAESLPFEEGRFDLITVALAFQWFDRERFLAEAHHVLGPQGWLVIYNHGFFGRMKENPDYERWNRESYLTRYPSPPRNRQPLTDADAEGFGFHFAKREEFKNDIPFTIDQLVAYLMTQSNVIAALEGGKETLESVQAWLADSLRPLFSRPTRTFLFGGDIWYLQRMDDRGTP